MMPVTVPEFLHGDPRPINADFNTADATVTFDVGNLLLTSSGKVINMGTSQTVTAFLGVARQRKPAGTTGTALRLIGNSTDGKIQVDTDGIWRFPRSDTIALVIGDKMTTDGTTANTLMKAGDESVAMAVCVENEAPSSGQVKVKIMSRLVPQAFKT